MSGAMAAASYGCWVAAAFVWRPGAVGLARGPRHVDAQAGPQPRAVDGDADVRGDVERGSAARVVTAGRAERVGERPVEECNEQTAERFG